MPDRLKPVPKAVADQAGVEEVVSACRAAGRMAFDTEFVMEDVYETEVCLVQVAAGDQVWIIDPLAKVDLSDLWALVGDAEIVKVVHAGQEDLALSVQHTGGAPRNVFDLQIAAGFIGLDYPISLQRLVQSLLHVRLHKSKTLTNWRKRPLTREQIRYAAEDVCYLLAVHDELVKRLRKMKRLDWVRQENARYEEITLYRRAEVDKLRRVKGAGTLNARQLAILSQVMLWRDAFARRVNRPARYVLKDHLLVEIARHQLSEVRDIRELRGVSLNDRDAGALAAAVSEALSIPESDWPKPKLREVEKPMETAVIALATAVIRSYCLENDIAYGLAATQRSIRELVRSCLENPADTDSVELLVGWRGKTVGRIAQDVILGKSAVVAECNGSDWGLQVRPA